MTMIASDSALVSLVDTNTTMAIVEASSPVQSRLQATRRVRVAMQRQDDLVIELIYADKKGELTRRVVSPIRFLDGDRFLALCLCRCEPRQFSLSRCSQIEIRQAADYLMPVPMESVSKQLVC